MKTAELLTEWIENKDFDKLWNKHVPASGEASTSHGEAVRAIGRFEYDYYNNGFGNVVDERKRSRRAGEPGIYGKLQKSLVDYLIEVDCPHSIMEAAKFMTNAKEWNREMDPKFEAAVKKLKEFMVKTVKEDQRSSSKVITEAKRPSFTIEIPAEKKAAVDKFIDDQRHCTVEPTSPTKKGNMHVWTIRAIMDSPTDPEDMKALQAAMKKKFSA